SSGEAPMRIAIIGVTGFRNRGVEALVVTTINGLLGRFPEAHFSIATWSPEFDRQCFNHPRVEFVLDWHLRSRTWTMPTIPPMRVWWRVWWKAAGLLGIKPPSPPSDATTLRLPFDRPDLLILSGGDL